MRNSLAVQLALLTCAILVAFLLGRNLRSTTNDTARLLELMEKNHAEMEEVKESIRLLTGESRSKVEGDESASKASPTGMDGKLARLLVTNSAQEKQKLIEEKLADSQNSKQLTLENVQIIATQLQSMNAILSSPESLEASTLDAVEKERNRLHDLLKTQIAPLVKSLDEMAIKELESIKAIGSWAKAGALLGYYPTSNIPQEAEVIQKIVSDHESVRTRISLLQKQRYNLWACAQIKKAWLDFSDSNIATKEAKIITCNHFLGPIETSYLEPISMELYRDFLEAIKKKVTSDEYQSMALSLAKAKRVIPGEDGLVK